MMAFYPSRRIDRATWEGEWPLTIAGGVLQLRDGYHVVLVAKQKVYAINGTAKGARHFFLDRPRYLPLDKIWRDDPQVPGLKVSVGPLIAMGLALGKKGEKGE